MIKETGGLAFPSAEQFSTERGMTLRDYFAGQACISLSQRIHGGLDIITYEKEIRNIGIRAYEIADAMLEERNK